MAGRTGRAPSLLNRPLTDDEISRIPAELIPLVEAELEDARQRKEWLDIARPEQLPPDGDWVIWLLVTGRRWGKTRTAAEWLRTRVLDQQGTYGICAPTFGDVRDVCVEQGVPARPSGFLSVCRPGEIRNYNRSMGEIEMRNGSRIKMLSADEPDRARGWGFDAVWCDEFSSWRRPETWYLTLLPATSMADTHRFVITTTPKPNLLTRDLLRQAETQPDKIRLVRGKTIDNAENLGAGIVDELRTQMSSRQARQELHGELLDEMDGALWTRELIERARYDTLPQLVQIAIGIDPSTWGPDVGNAHDTIGVGIETGLVVVGTTGGEKPDLYVLEDLSGRYSPDVWARKACDAWYRWSDLCSTVIVPEVNAGLGLVTATIRLVDSTPRIYSSGGKAGVKATAGHGKRARAEPVAALYEQGRAHHPRTNVDVLEDQMVGWDPSLNWSPDRIDALVWAVHALCPWMEAGGTIGAKEISAARLPELTRKYDPVFSR